MSKAEQWAVKAILDVDAYGPDGINASNYRELLGNPILIVRLESRAKCVASHAPKVASGDAKKIAEALMQNETFLSVLVTESRFCNDDDARLALVSLIAPHLLDAEKLARGILDNEVLINIIHNYAHNPEFYKSRLKSYLTDAITKFKESEGNKDEC